MDNNEITRIVKYCRRIGLFVKQGKNMHWQVYIPNGNIVVMSSTAGGKEALNKIKSDFKRNGIILFEK